MKKIAIVTALILTGCSLPTAEPEVTADSVLDNRIFASATAELELTQCENILDENKKAECSTAVNDLILTNLAESEIDSEICKKIENKRYKENCLNNITAQLKSTEEAQKIVESEQFAVDNNDPTFCDQISELNERASCKFNVIANQAISLKDPSICKGIGLESMIKECENSSK